MLPAFVQLSRVRFYSESWHGLSRDGSDFLLCGLLNSYGMVWGVLLSSLKTDHYPDTSLATLTLIAGLQNLGQNVAPFISG